jgi:hypothetical protein
MPRIVEEDGMAVDGIWKITVDTPMGTQQGTLTLKTDGATLTGSQQSSTGGTMPVLNGKVDGNKLTWQSEMTQPFAVKLAFEVTVNGDSMTGEVKAGGFGSSALKGVRA